MAKACTPARKRFGIAIPLGIVFGFVCTWLAASSTPGIWWSPLMWTLVADRFLIGLVVALAGAYTIHPIFRFRCPPARRGAVLGAIVSLPLAAGVMIVPVGAPAPWNIFWATILVGAIYGLIIDLVATKWGGQWAELLK